MLCVTDSHDYQLVTWSKDQSLRLWRIDPQLQMVSDQGTLLSQNLLVSVGGVLIQGLVVTCCNVI